MSDSATAALASVPKNVLAHSVDPLDEEKRLLKEQDAGLADEEDASISSGAGDDAVAADHHLDDAVKNVSCSVKWSDTPRNKIPAYFQLELTDYQALSLEKMESAPNQASILAQDMGLGKTATSLGYICNRISRHKREFGTMNGSQHLVSAPKSVVRQWMAEFSKFVSPEAGIKIKLMTDKITAQDVQQIVRGEINIVITTPYRILDAFKDLCIAAGLSAFAESRMAYKSSDDVRNMHRLYTDWCKTASEPLRAKFDVYISPNGLDARVQDKRTNGSVIFWPFSPKWSTFVIDEAHQIRNCGIINWRAQFCVPAVSRVLLTATPLHTSLNDIYSYLRFLRIANLVASDVWFATGYASFDNKDTYLDGMCKNILIWMRKKDIPGLNIVPKLNFHVLAPISNPIEERYYSEWSAMAGKFAKAATTGNKQTKKEALVKVRVAILRCRQVCGAAATLPEAVRLNGFSEKDFPGIKDRNGWAGTHSSKLNELVNIARDHIKKGEKFTVVSSFVGLVNLVMERFAEEGIGCAHYVGSMSESERSATIARFKDDPKISALVCSLGAGHVGLSLGWAVRAMNIDPWWNPQILLQAENRVHRYDSKGLVKITYLIMAGTIEEAIMKIAQARLEMASAFHKASSLRELLSMKRFATPEPARFGDKRKGGPGASAPALGPAPPRFESLAKDAEVLWLNRKNVTKTVCEECIYEANLKELAERNTGDKAKPRAVLEEEAYAGVRLKKEAMTIAAAKPDETMVDVPEVLDEVAEEDEEKEPESANKKSRTQKDKQPAPKVPDVVTPKPTPAPTPVGPSETTAVADSFTRVRLETVRTPTQLFAAVKRSFDNEAARLRPSALLGMQKYSEDLETSSAVFVSLDRKTANLSKIEKELAAHGGMLKSQADSIQASKTLWDETVLSAMRTTAIKAGKTASQTAAAAFRSELQALASDACLMPEMTMLHQHIHQVIACTRTRVSADTTESTRLAISHIFDPILPLIAFTNFEDKLSDTTNVTGAASEPLPAVVTSERPHMLHVVGSITKSVVIAPAATKKGQPTLRSALMSGETPVNRLPYLAALNYARYTASKNFTSIELKVGLYDEFASVRIDAGSLFLIYASHSLLISDFVPIVSEGYAINKIRAAIAKELKTEHLTVAYMPTPRHVLCPTWLHERVHQALKERSEKDVYVCNTFGRAATNPLIEMKMQLRRIFRPWWCELTLVV